MALRNIRTDQEPCLYAISRPVEKYDGRLQQLIDDMFETLESADGAGLAAPQVGILKRVIVVNTGDETYELVNPEIVSSSGSIGAMEGCLSFPGKFGYVERAAEVSVTGFDRNGKPVERHAEGMEARILQHETDHLNGVVYLTKVIEPPEDYPERNNL